MFSKIIILFLLSLQLIADETMVDFTPSVLEINNTTFLALTYNHKNGWHTYYKNPGDSGEATKFKFYLNNQEIKLDELPWPFPKTINYGDVTTYGYSKTATIFFNIDGPLLSKKLQIKTSWLACNKICVPGGSEKIITLSPQSSLQRNFLLQEFAKIPKVIQSPPKLLTLNLVRDEMNKKIIIYYKLQETISSSLDPKKNLLIPLTTNQYTFSQGKLNKDKRGHLSGIIEAEWDGEYEEPPIPFPTLEKIKQKLLFKFAYLNPNSNKSIIFSHRFKSSNPVSNIHLNNNPTPEKHSIWYYLLFAFLGGIILNFMPCVLPVISLKLFGLIKHRDERHYKILKHNLAYTLGILITFSLLAFVVILLKVIGQQVGWGFQLQSPIFIGLMIFALFIFALNMFGLFEFSTPGGKLLGNLKLQDTFIGDIFSGILAVILSTPCSAPFLGTALTFAFTSTPIFIFIFFLTIGIGLATPFILTGLVPQMLKFLPRPGNWMNIFKKFLGLTLLITVIWLADIFYSLTSLKAATVLLSPPLLFIFLGILLHKKNKTLTRTLYLITFISLILFVIYNQTFNESKQIRTSRMLQEYIAKGLPFETWTIKKMSTGNKLQFIDFSARWCLTCKINEEVILNTDKFKALIKKYNVKLLLADWTDGDEVITKWLNQHGHAGVPAYFIVSPKGKIYNLGETITIDEIETNIKKAQNEDSL